MLMYFCILFMCGLWVFIFSSKHLLVMLLSLEFIVLVLFISLYYYVIMMSGELFLTMFFMTFSVCEGALGLSILVSMVRMYGNDFFFSFGLLQC
nr:NADH dehydrogenase subunit 4L [Metallyticus sp. JZ-2017]